MARARSRARSHRDATIQAPQTGNRRHAQATGLPLFQWRKRLRDGGLMVETAPKRERRHKNRQHGDHTHTHTSPLRTRYALLN